MNYDYVGDLLDTVAWVSLHEFGHGYDGTFGDNKEVNINDITNNVLSHYYQTAKRDLTTAEGRKNSWLFNYENSNAQSLDGAVIARRTEVLCDFSSLGLREKLYALITMYNSAGNTTAQPTHRKFTPPRIVLTEK